MRHIGLKTNNIKYEQYGPDQKSMNADCPECKQFLPLQRTISYFGFGHLRAVERAYNHQN